jgi:hypothetical protein
MRPFSPAVEHCHESLKMFDATNLLRLMLLAQNQPDHSVMLTDDAAHGASTATNLKSHILKKALNVPRSILFARFDSTPSNG